MADKVNGQTGASTPKKGISKMEAVRQALGHFGSDAKPSEMQPWIKSRFGIDNLNGAIQIVTRGNAKP